MMVQIAGSSSTESGGVRLAEPVCGRVMTRAATACMRCRRGLAGLSARTLEAFGAQVTVVDTRNASAAVCRTAGFRHRQHLRPAPISSSRQSVVALVKEWA